MGASADCSLRSSAVSSLPALLLVSLTIGPFTPWAPPRAVMAVATLPRPNLQGSPLAPSALEATPNTRASITARPTKNTVALPTHITLLTVLRNISATSLVRWTGLVPHHYDPAGYRRASFSRASSEVKRHSTVAPLSLRSRSHAPTSRPSFSSSGTRRPPRHCLCTTLNSISTWLSQDACLGV